VAKNEPIKVDVGNGQFRESSKNPGRSDSTDLAPVPSPPILLPHTIKRNLMRLSHAVESANEVQAARKLCECAQLIHDVVKIQRYARSLQNDAAEVKLQADRKLGQLLLREGCNKVGRPKKLSHHVSVSEKHGISDMQSSRYKALATLRVTSR